MTSPEQRQAAQSLFRCEATFRDKEDLILVGAYAKGSDPGVDAAVELRGPILRFVRQAPEEHSLFADTHRELGALAARIDALSGQKPT